MQVTDLDRENQPTKHKVAGILMFPSLRNSVRRVLNSSLKAIYRSVWCGVIRGPKNLLAL